MLVIAIDGPAASGKGALARRLAAHLGLRHLDSGRLYRAAALRLRLDEARPENAEAAAAAARAIVGIALDDARLNDSVIAQWASIAAAHRAVRAAVLEHQRRFAATPPGAVIDGRDIGTVVCPDAAVKLFLTADVAERARRRHAELVKAGGAPSIAEVRAEIEARDRRDEERAVAPMKPAPDAIVLDTSALDLDGVFRAALAVVCPQLAKIEAAGTSCDSAPGPL